MVIENKRKFEEENQRKVEIKKAKNLKIWEEQKRQIEEKRKITGAIKGEDREFFHSVGCKASDKFYINQDKKTAYEATLKGNAGKMAEVLRAKQNAEYQSKVQRMK
jgi:hypothetical protein